MPTRTGFDLQADQCRIVEVHVRPVQSPRPADLRVRTFATLPVGSESETLAAELRRVRQDQRLAPRAWVTIWGLRSVHQFLRLPPAKDADLSALAAREARRELAPLEEEGGPPSIAIMAGADVQVGTHRRREVSLLAASEPEIKRRIQPLLDAGFDVRGVSTPALALVSVARQRGEAAPGATSLYVALEAHATCVAVVRDGVLLFAREIPWGYGDGQEPVGVRLAAELRRSMQFFRQTFRTAVEAVVLCGGMPNLRALTSSVGSSLGVPVLTLDSLSGVDVEAIPEPADAFRALVASLWLAMAPAAEDGPRANLLPAAIRSMREWRSELVRAAAAFVLGVVVVTVWYVAIKGASPDRASEIAAAERRIAFLEPEAGRLAAERRTLSIAGSQQAAYRAFETQGPRLARVLEVVSRSTPPDVVVNEIDVQAEGAQWRTVISGTSVTADASVGQGEVSRLLQGLSQSPFVGPAVQPPSFRVASGRGGTAAEDAAPAPVPEGMTGVEFSARFRVSK